MPSSWIAPPSLAATTLHRSLIAAQARRRADLSGPARRAVTRALQATADGTQSPAERQALIAIEGRRAELPFAMATTEMEFGLAPPEGGDATETRVATVPPTASERLGHAWEICRWTCISPIWGLLLFRLIRELRPKRCLELGTGLGLSGAYQASALRLNGSGSITTVDINPAANVAAAGFEALGLDEWITLEFGDLDEDLDSIASGAPIDYAFLDAEHSEAATTRHFEALLPHLADEAVLVFDDITQGDGMRRAWRHVVTHEQVGHSVALRRFGIAVVSRASG